MKKKTASLPNYKNSNKVEECILCGLKMKGKFNSSNQIVFERQISKGHNYQVEDVSRNGDVSVPGDVLGLIIVHYISKFSKRHIVEMFHISTKYQGSQFSNANHAGSYIDVYISLN